MLVNRHENLMIQLLLFIVAMKHVKLVLDLYLIIVKVVKILYFF